MIGIFTAIAVILVVTVAATFFVRDISQSQEQKDKSTAVNKPAVPLWKNLKVLFGFVAIFLVLGTEGGVFSFYQVYLKSMTATLTDLQKSTFAHFIPEFSSHKTSCYLPFSLHCTRLAGYWAVSFNGK